MDKGQEEQGCWWSRWDGIREIEEKIGVERFLKGIEEDLREGRYKTQPIRRVYIPKPNG